MKNSLQSGKGGKLKMSPKNTIGATVKWMRIIRKAISAGELV